MCTKFWLGDTKETDHFEDLAFEGNIPLKWIFKKSNGKVWTVSIWLRLRTGSRRL